ncbi:MAG: glycosyltransferase, partial [Saprospiraceae bacterium]
RKNIISYLGETEDVRPFLEDTSCLVFPSFYNEGISRILLEAAAMGKLIITTDNVGCRDVVEDNFNGFICQPKDKNDLARKILKFIELPFRDQELMGLNGRKVVINKFSEERVINIYINFLNRHFDFQPVFNKSLKSPSSS